MRLLAPLTALLLVFALAPAVATARVLWSTDHESGDFTDWERLQYGDAVFNSNTPPGTATAEISTDVARSGQHALKMTITGASGSSKQGVRVFRWEAETPDAGLPRQAWYSAWYFIPEAVQTADWWNVFQFKSKIGDDSKPMFSFNLESADDGTLGAYVWHHRTGQPNRAYRSQARVPLRPGRWFHLEALLRQSSESDGRLAPDGRLALWVNGTRTLDQQGIFTLRDPGAELSWSVNNYTDEISPSNLSIYVDDPAIADARLGTGGRTVLRPGRRIARRIELNAGARGALPFTMSGAGQAQVVVGARHSSGARPFVASLWCGGRRLAARAGRRGTAVRLRAQASDGSCSVRVRAGREPVAAGVVVTRSR